MTTNVARPTVWELTNEYAAHAVRDFFTPLKWIWDLLHRSPAHKSLSRAMLASINLADTPYAPEDGDFRPETQFDCIESEVILNSGTGMSPSRKINVIFTFRASRFPGVMLLKASLFGLIVSLLGMTVTLKAEPDFKK